MVFTSPIFLFIFLPLVWLIHAALPAKNEKLRNSFLLFASLIFYLYGERNFVFLILATILVSFCVIFLIQKREKWKVPLAALGIVVNLSFLFFFKYANFFSTQLNAFLSLFSLSFPVVNPYLPLGISFFTFQAVSSIIDVCREPKRDKVSLINTALYISFFPQLVAGPIVRYFYFIPQIKRKAVHYLSFLYGIKRFVYGLAKKVLISNTLAATVDKIYAMDSGKLSFSLAWCTVFMFALQVYFDFSGYSDMAIGLARMFGIKIPENFNYPFVSRSVREFWRRWHISLSTWFRDYLYFPLGGSKKGELRTYLNLFIVFFVCGFWHGASWNFVLFGFMNGCWLIGERFFRSLNFNINKNLEKLIGHIYMFFIFALIFLIFRATSISQIFEFLIAMLGQNQSDVSFFSIFDMKTLFTALAGLICAFPVYGFIVKKLRKFSCFKALEALFVAVLFAFSISHSSMVFSDPFVYFRF